MAEVRNRLDEGTNPLGLQEKIKDLETKAMSIHTLEALDRLRVTVDAVAQEALKLGIHFDATGIITTAAQNAAYNENQTAEDRARITLEEARQAQDAQAKYEQNQKRETELKLLTKEYKEFQDNFLKELDEEHELVRKAINGKLTDKERDKLLGQYSSKEEEEADKKRQAKMAQYWATHYDIKEKASSAIRYRQGEIAKNDQLIQHHDTLSKEKVRLQEANRSHAQAVSAHLSTLELLKPSEERRESERQDIKDLVKAGQIDIAVQKLKDHHEQHGQKYEQELKTNPNYLGYHEFHALVKACGGHKILGIPEPQYDASSQQFGLPQNIISKPAQHTVQTVQSSIQIAQHPKELADNIRQNHSKVQINTKASYNSSITPNNTPKVHKELDTSHTQSAKSKFSQRGHNITTR